MTRLFVSDTNIWIDFHYAGLLEELFQLPYELCTTDFAFREMTRPPGADLAVLGLQVMSLESAMVVEIFAVKGQLTKPSLADVSCYILAKSLKCGLLTGDGDLRKAASKEVEVHGVLWLLDQLIEQGVIQKRRAALALRAMLEKGARLPQAECDARLKDWGV